MTLIANLPIAALMLFLFALLYMTHGLEEHHLRMFLRRYYACKNLHVDLQMYRVHDCR